MPFLPTASSGASWHDFVNGHRRNGFPLKHLDRNGDAPPDRYGIVLPDPEAVKRRRAHPIGHVEFHMGTRPAVTFSKLSDGDYFSLPDLTLPGLRKKSHNMCARRLPR